MNGAFEAGKKYVSKSGYEIEVERACQKSVVLKHQYWYGNPRHTLKQDELGTYITIRHKYMEEKVYASNEVA